MKISCSIQSYLSSADVSFKGGRVHLIQGTKVHASLDIEMCSTISERAGHCYYQTLPKSDLI